MHTCVGFCVVRFDRMGNARARFVGRVTGTATHAFFIHVPNIFNSLLVSSLDLGLLASTKV